MQIDRNLLLIRLTCFGNVTQSHIITAFRNKITLKAPPGESIYMYYVLCRLRMPALFNSVSTQNLFSSETLESIVSFKNRCDKIDIIANRKVY